MAKTTGPLMSMTASGKFGDAIVFLKNGSARKWVKPANPQTVDQMAWRNQLKDIAAVMFVMGANLRTQLKTNFGARWFSDIVGDLTNNQGSALGAYGTEWDAFTSQQKTDWGTAQTATTTVIADGKALYAVASAVYDRAGRLGVTIDLTLPAAGNSATVGVEWLATS